MQGTSARWLAAAAVVTSFFLLLGAAPLFDVDEGAFSQATLEMFQRGDFLSTTLNGEPRYDKPILVYWLQAASVALFGVREWAFRLPSALCAAAWAWLTYLFVRRHYDAGRALQRPGLGPRRQPALLLSGGADSQPAVHGADRASGAAHPQHLAR